jgi:hypothetical protein
MNESPFTIFTVKTEVKISVRCEQCDDELEVQYLPDANSLMVTPCPNCLEEAKSE